MSKDVGEPHRLQVIITAADNHQGDGFVGSIRRRDPIPHRHLWPPAAENRAAAAAVAMTSNPSLHGGSGARDEPPPAHPLQQHPLPGLGGGYVPGRLEPMMSAYASPQAPNGPPPSGPGYRAGHAGEFYEAHEYMPQQQQQPGVVVAAEPLPIVRVRTSQLPSGNCSSQPVYAYTPGPPYRPPAPGSASSMSSSSSSSSTSSSSASSASSASSSSTMAMKSACAAPGRTLSPAPVSTPPLPLLPPFYGIAAHSQTESQAAARPGLGSVYAYAQQHPQGTPQEQHQPQLQQSRHYQQQLTTAGSTQCCPPSPSSHQLHQHQQHQQLLHHHHHQRPPSPNYAAPQQTCAPQPYPQLIPERPYFPRPILACDRLGAPVFDFRSLKPLRDLVVARARRPGTGAGAVATQEWYRGEYRPSGEGGGEGLRRGAGCSSMASCSRTIGGGGGSGGAVVQSRMGEGSVEELGRDGGGGGSGGAVSGRLGQDGEWEWEADQHAPAKKRLLLLEEGGEEEMEREKRMMTTMAMTTMMGGEDAESMTREERDRLEVAELREKVLVALDSRWHG